VSSLPKFAAERRPREDQLVHPRWALLALTTACAGRAHAPAGATDVDDPAARASATAPALEGYRADFVLSWNGQRIGEAREQFHAEGDAWRFERTERTVVRREGATATARTEILVDVDLTLTARRVRVTRWIGATRSEAEAVRLVDDAWRVTQGGESRLVDGAAVPSTLVPLLVAGGNAGREWSAPVLVEGAGLARAELTVSVPPGGGRADSELTTPVGRLRGTAWLDSDGFVARVGESSGVASRRVDAGELEQPFDPPELVDSSAVPVTGTLATAEAIRISGLPPVGAIPELPRQQIATRDGAFDIRLFSAITRSLPPEVREATHAVARSLADDPAVGALSNEEALSAGRGDCTAHAVVLVRRLRDRGTEARLVTGFLVVDGALRRHRWVVVRVGADWVPVDPTRDEAPAVTPRIALLVHDADLEQLAFVDDVAFAGWGAAKAHALRTWRE
jgi:Transglutaminase-like superfamily